MPQCCVVPECSNRKSGHRFPKDKDLLKKWMVAIRRDTVIQGGKVRDVLPSPHWRVCNDHFAPEDFVISKDSVLKIPRPILKKDVVPSRFAWTRRVSDTAIKKRERGNQLRSQTITTHSIGTNDLVAKKAVINSAPPPLVYFSQPTENLEEIQHVNEIKAEPVVLLEGAEFHVQTEYHEEEELNVVTEYQNEGEYLSQTNYHTKSAGIQCSLCSCGCGPGEECKLEENTSQSSTVTSITGFQIEHLFNKVDELKFYTGFDDYDHFMFVFNILGDEVNSLQYFAADQGCTLFDHLSPVNQFFMTVVKLRRNMSYAELGFRFGVSSIFVEVIVVTWINFLFKRLKVLKLFAQMEEMEKYLNMKEEKRCSEGTSTTSKFKVHTVNTPETQKTSHTIYKFCFTFKVVVGILPNGWLDSVSEAFGETTKDGELIAKTYFKNLLQDGDVILCDQGLGDLVTDKNVTFETSEFTKLKPYHYRKIAHLGTTFEILQNRLSSDLEQLVSKIVYVCMRLANFLS